MHLSKDEGEKIKFRFYYIVIRMDFEATYTVGEQKRYKQMLKDCKQCNFNYLENQQRLILTLKKMKSLKFCFFFPQEIE